MALLAAFASFVSKPSTLNTEAVRLASPERAIVARAARPASAPATDVAARPRPVTRPAMNVPALPNVCFSRSANAASVLWSLRKISPTSRSLSSPLTSKPSRVMSSSTITAGTPLL
jgi:hypothetical protein